MVLGALGLGQLTKRLGIGGGGPAPKTVGYSTTLRTSDFMDTTTPTDITTVNGSYVKLGNGYTVPAQRGYRWGYGNPSQPENQGYLYISLVDDTASNGRCAPQGDKVQLHSHPSQCSDCIGAWGILYLDLWVQGHALPMPLPRGTSCTSCRYRRGTGRCGPPCGHPRRLPPADAAYLLRR